MNQGIPLVDLRAQYLSMKDDIDTAIAAVVAETAFVGVSSNRFVRAFEEEFAEYVGVAHCIAAANGTDSLEILLKAAGIGAGDEVLVPALSWIATSEAVSTCGATPVFVDVLPSEYTIDPADAAAKATSRTKAIIPVHLYGLPARMPEVMRLAERHHLFVLEDCAQAHGARCADRQVGTFGHAASYSFFPGKNLGAWGDAGGMVTNDAQLARTARMIGQHGQTERKHDHQIEGRNSRMDGLQAAILSAKLKHLDAWTGARRQLAREYRVALEGAVSSFQASPADFDSVYHLFTVELEARDAVQAEMAKMGVSTAVQYPTPLPFLPAYASFGHVPREFPVAAAVTRRILSIPIYPEIDSTLRDRIVTAVKQAVAAAVQP